MPIVLGVDSSFAVQRSGSVGRSNGELLEDALEHDATLSNSIEISIFAIGIDHAIGIHHGSVHAPLKTIGMVGNAGNGPIRVAD